MRKYLVAASALFITSGPASAAWDEVENTVSQIDNSRVYVASVRSTNELPNAIGSPDNATLMVRCKAGTLDVLVSWPPFMGSDDHQVRWRFDDGATIWSQSWTGSENGTATFARDPGEFLAHLAVAQKVVISASPYEKDEVEAVFNVSGAGAVSKAALGACPK